MRLFVVELCALLLVLHVPRGALRERHAPGLVVPRSASYFRWRRPDNSSHLFIGYINPITNLKVYSCEGRVFFEHPEYTNYPRYLRLQIAGANIPHETKNIIYRAVKKALMRRISRRGLPCGEPSMRHQPPASSQHLQEPRKLHRAARPLHQQEMPRKLQPSHHPDDQHSRWSAPG